MLYSPNVLMCFFVYFRVLSVDCLLTLTEKVDDAMDHAVLQLKVRGLNICTPLNGSGFLDANADLGHEET